MRYGEDADGRGVIHPGQPKKRKRESHVEDVRHVHARVGEWDVAASLRKTGSGVSLGMLHGFTLKQAEELRDILQEILDEAQKFGAA